MRDMVVVVSVCWQRGKTKEEAEALLVRAVELACETRDKFWSETKQVHDDREGGCYKRCRPLVATSVGCFGATQADGSEYTGKYEVVNTVHKLMEWHRPRLRVLAKVMIPHKP